MGIWCVNCYYIITIWYICIAGWMLLLLLLLMLLMLCCWIWTTWTWFTIFNKYWYSNSSWWTCRLLNFLFCLVFYLFFIFFLIKHTWLCWFCSAIAFSFACLLHLYLWFWNQIFTWKKTNKKILIRSRKDYEKFPSTAQSVFFSFYFAKNYKSHKY